MALRERGPTAINGRCPRSGRVSDRADPVPIRRSGVGITSLTVLRLYNPLTGSCTTERTWQHFRCCQTRTARRRCDLNNRPVKSVTYQLKGQPGGKTCASAVAYPGATYPSPVAIGAAVLRQRRAELSQVPGTGQVERIRTVRSAAATATPGAATAARASEPGPGRFPAASAASAPFTPRVPQAPVQART
jgi:hypothetical protein